RLRRFRPLWTQTLSRSGRVWVCRRRAEPFSCGLLLHPAPARVSGLLYMAVLERRNREDAGCRCCAGTGIERQRMAARAHRRPLCATGAFDGRQPTLLESFRLLAPTAVLAMGLRLFRTWPGGHHFVCSRMGRSRAGRARLDLRAGPAIAEIL